MEARRARGPVTGDRGPGTGDRGRSNPDCARSPHFAFLTQGGPGSRRTEA
jgi:hypothetical protein